MYKRKLEQRSQNRDFYGGNRMIFNPAPNLQGALLSLGLQGHGILNQNIGYRPVPPKMMKYDQGLLYRSRPTARSLRFRRFAPKKGVAPVRKRQYSYRCLFCNQTTHNRDGHLEHVKTEKHNKTVDERKVYLSNKLRKLLLQVQEENLKLERNSKEPLQFCHVCSVKFSGPRNAHNQKILHQEFKFMTEIQCMDCHQEFNNRIRFEKHLLTLDHLRNRYYRQMKQQDHTHAKDLLQVKEYDSDKVTGFEFVGDVRGHYCQICDELFLHKDMSLGKHSQSEKHYEKFKEYAKKKLEELKKKSEQEDGNESKAEQETEETEPMEEDEEYVEGEEADNRGEDDADQVDEEAENVEGEEAENVEGEEAENVEAEDVEGEEAEDVEGEEAEDVEGEDAENVEGEDAENVEGEDAEDMEGEEAEDMEGENVDGEEVEDDAENVEGEEADDVEGENANDDEVENVEGEEAENVDEEFHDAEEGAGENEEQLDYEEETESSKKEDKASPAKKVLPRRSRRSK